MRLALILAVLPVAALADCPAPPDHAGEVASLLAELKAAPDQPAAAQLMDDLWRIWTDAPDATAQALLDDGMDRREAYDFAGAREILDRLVDYCPDYAEGWNQRAFASFLSQNYDDALADLDRALALNPTHLGALSGRAMTLMGLGRVDEAQVTLREAVALNPWLAERALLIEAPGQDI